MLSTLSGFFKKSIFGICLLWACSCIQSCSFENDETFAYQRRAIFASWLDTTTNQMHLAELIQNQDKWKQNISSFCIQPEGIWVGSPQNISYFDLVKGKEVSFPTTIVPHLMVADENYLVIADTNAQKLVFHRIGNKGSKESFAVQLSQKTKGLFLKQGRAAIVGKLGKFEVYDAGSATLLTSFDYAQAIQYCAMDNLYNILIGTNLESKFNLNTLTPGASNQTTWDTVAASPFRNMVYETEFTGRIGQKGKTLSLTNWTEAVDKFWPDFQNSEIYFTRSDSVFAAKIGKTASFQNWKRPIIQMDYYWNVYQIK